MRSPSSTAQLHVIQLARERCILRPIHALHQSTQFVFSIFGLSWGVPWTCVARMSKMSQLQLLLFTSSRPMMPTLGLPQRVSLLRIVEMLATRTLNFTLFHGLAIPSRKNPSNLALGKIHIFVCVDPGKRQSGFLPVSTHSYIGTVSWTPSASAHAVSSRRAVNTESSGR